MQLTGPQIGQFNDVIRDAFTTDDFDLFLLHRLDKRTSDYASSNANFPVVVNKVIDAANRQGWITDLIVKAREANSGNEKLWAFAQQFGMASTTKPRQELQRMIEEAKFFLDINVWRSRLAEVEGQVCRIEFETDQGKVLNGTGFLFGGPDSILTNYHVMEPVIAAKEGRATDDGLTAQAKNVKCRFDFKRLYDPVTKKEGAVANPGTVFNLAEDWLIDSSQNHPLDQPPPPDHLDYALIRLDTAAGEGTVGDKENQFGNKRGYIDLPTDGHEFKAKEPLSIVQHPRGRPLQLALDTEAVLEVNANSTRVTYKTNTESGSSGSPCFTLDWNLVALHHSGDPDFDPAHKPSYNEGIPISAITKLLRDRGVDKKIGKQEL
jgi:Trypsin-like peptidase domain/Effector-associated domain 1